MMRLPRVVVDAVAFGTKFISNPDLVARFEKDAELVEADKPATFYTGDAKGYTDYAFLSESSP